MRRHRSTALRVATVVLGTAEGADDVVQVATERAWRALGAFDPDRPFLPWFLRIVANGARNDRRSRGRRAALAVRVAARQQAEHIATPEEQAVTDADRERVLAALNKMRADDRLVIALRYFEQMPERDMAGVLGCPLGTVKSRVSRAMNRLRVELGGDDRG